MTITTQAILDAYAAQTRALAAEAAQQPAAERSGWLLLHAWRGTRTTVHGWLQLEKPPTPAPAAVLRDVLGADLGDGKKHDVKRTTKSEATAARNAEAIRLATAGDREGAAALLARPLDRPLLLDRQTSRDHETHSVTQKHHMADLWEEADRLVVAAGITAEAGPTPAPAPAPTPAPAKGGK